MSGSARGRLARSIDTVEEAYEFFLAYAAQGLGREAEGTRVEGQLRTHLTAMREAVAELAELVRRVGSEGGVPSPERLAAFGEVVAADARRAGAALDLVDAQPVATSQLVDNLNASVHVRALLTDLFLLDEALGLAGERAEAGGAGAAGGAAPGGGVAPAGGAAPGGPAHPA